MLKKYKLGLYHVLQQFPSIAKYMSERYIPNSIPLTLIVAELRKPTIQIGETEEDMRKWENCLHSFGNLPNHKYVATSNTEHKVWEKAPDIVIEEISKLYLEVAN